MNSDAQVSIKFTNTITNENKLKNYAETLQKIHSVLSSIDTGKIEQIEKANKVMQDTTSEAKTMAKEVDFAFNYNKIKVFARTLANVYSGIVKVTQKSSEFLESFNLFQVAFDDNYKEAEKFINKMSEMYGLDEAWLTKTTALFKQLANAMGMSAETGDKLSTLLTQMSVDISSLYNLDVDKVPQILQSALAGQTKPARRLGADITQTTLQQTLSGLGIDQSVVNLSYAEKRLLIVISLTKQLTQATNDWGRTIESPANQMRILSEQFNRLTREVGNVFLPILAKVLPYLNAIVMVLTEIIAIIARLFGYNKDDFDYFETMTDDVYDFGDGVSSATSKVEKLKRGLRGFDKLNNITTPTAASGGAGAGIGTGINPKLMSAFNDAYDEYFKKIDKVSMKATQIRDNIMEWLGFQKNIDEETDDVYFTFEKITGGTILGALVVGGSIFKGISLIYKILKSIGLLKFPLISSLFGLGKGSGIVSGAGDIAGAVSKNAKSFIIPSWQQILEGLKSLGLIIAACGALILVYSIIAAIPGAKDFLTEGIDLLVKSFVGIGKILIPIIGISAVCAALGAASALIVPGLGTLGVILLATSGLILIAGGVSQIEGVNDFVDKGIDLLCKVFEGIGKLAGAIVGGFIAKVSEGFGKSLENFGKSLSVFMTNAQPFFEASTKYGAATFQAISALASALLAITTSTLVENLTSWLTGGNSLENFGKQLAAFAPYFDSFSRNISGVKDGTVEKTKIIAEAMGYIIDFTKKIPNSGGAAGFFAGENDLDDFAKQLPAFGKDFTAYANFVAKASSSVVDDSKRVKEAMNYIIDFAKRIPNEGGVAAFFAGDNGIAEFGKNLKNFGTDFKLYSNEIKGVNTENINNVTKAISLIVDNAKTIKDNGLGKTMKDFGSNLKDSAKNITSFFTTAFSTDAGKSAGETFGKGIVKGIRSAINNGSFKLSLKDSSGNEMGGKYQFKASAAYAQGGLPPVGQMFLARENGAELVGTIGNQTAVMNNDQIVSSVSSGVETAVTRAMKNANIGSGGIYNIYLDPEHKIGSYTLEQLQDMAKSNGKPIKIGG